MKSCKEKILSQNIGPYASSASKIMNNTGTKQSSVGAEIDGLIEGP